MSPLSLIYKISCKTAIFQGIFSIHWDICFQQLSSDWLKETLTRQDEYLSLSEDYCSLLVYYFHYGLLELLKPFIGNANLFLERDKREVKILVCTSFGKFCLYLLIVIFSTSSNSLKEKKNSTFSQTEEVT